MAAESSPTQMAASSDPFLATIRKYFVIVFHWLLATMVVVQATGTK